MTKAKIKFLVAGGIAMNLHGLQRSTMDLDLIVFSFYHSKNTLNIIDVFVEHPKPFGEMFKNKKTMAIGKNKIHAVGLEDMLYLKSKANRPKDEFDIRFLRSILHEKKNG